MKGLTDREYAVLTCPLDSWVSITYEEFEGLRARGLLEGHWSDFGVTPLGELAVRTADQSSPEIKP